MAAMASSSAPTPTSMLRVALGGRYVGFVEIGARTSLRAVRALVAQALDADVVPRHFQFLDAEGAAVGTRREPALLAAAFLPCLGLLPVGEAPLAAGARVALWTRRHAFAMWALPRCTLGQLRAEAARALGAAVEARASHRARGAG